MLIISDLRLVDDLTGDELKVLLKITKMVVVENQAPPTNEELAKACGMGQNKFKRIRKALEDKSLILRRPNAGGRTDYKVTTNGVGGIVGAAEGQRRREQPPDPPKAAAPPPKPLPEPTPPPPKPDDLEPLEVVEEVDRGEGYKAILLTDREYIYRRAQTTGRTTEEVKDLLTKFVFDMQDTGKDKWKDYQDFKFHFLNWIKYQPKNGNNSYKTRDKGGGGLHDNGQIISSDEANRILQNLVNESSAAP